MGFKILYATNVRGSIIENRNLRSFSAVLGCQLFDRGLDKTRNEYAKVSRVIRLAFRIGHTWNFEPDERPLSVGSADD